MSEQHESRLPAVRNYWQDEGAHLQAAAGKFVQTVETVAAAYKENPTTELTYKATQTSLDEVIAGERARLRAIVDDARREDPDKEPYEVLSYPDKMPLSWLRELRKKIGVNVAWEVQAATLDVRRPGPLRPRQVVHVERPVSEAPDVLGHLGMIGQGTSTPLQLTLPAHRVNLYGFMCPWGGTGEARAYSLGYTVEPRLPILEGEFREFRNALPEYPELHMDWYGWYNTWAGGELGPQKPRDLAITKDISVLHRQQGYPPYNAMRSVGRLLTDLGTYLADNAAAQPRQAHVSQEPGESRNWFES